MGSLGCVGALARHRYFVRSILLFFPYYLLIVCFAAVSLLFRFRVVAVPRRLISVVIAKGYDCRRCFAAVSLFNHVLFTHFGQKPEHAGWRPSPGARHEADGVAKLAPVEVHDMPPGPMAARLPRGLRDEPYERLTLRKFGRAERWMLPHGARYVERPCAHAAIPRFLPMMFHGGSNWRMYCRSTLRRSHTGTVLNQVETHAAALSISALVGCAESL